MYFNQMINFFFKAFLKKINFNFLESTPFNTKP